MSNGRITFIPFDVSARCSPSWRASSAVAEADFVISTRGAVPTELLRHAPHHADVFLDEIGTTHSLLPFYDLAAREGFRIAHISSDGPRQWEMLAEHLDRCAELGLTTEIARP